MTASGFRLSALQKNILTVVAVLDARQPGTPVPTRLIEQLLAQSGDKPVYGPNLRDSCRRLEAAGLVRRLRASNLQLAIELTATGRARAASFLDAERQAEDERQRAAEVRVLPVRPTPADGTLQDVALEIAGQTYQVCRGDFVVRLDGTTCLQLWSTDGRRQQLTGGALQVAAWYQHCYDAGLPVRLQVNAG